MECFTADWFYNESGKKYKRCGSAKVIRELYKREKQLCKYIVTPSPSPLSVLAEIDEDVGYGTLQKSFSTDSGSGASYVVHDKNLRNELNQYSQRMNVLLENLQSDLSGRDKRKIFISIYFYLFEVYLDKVNLKDHLQLITSEISRARMALSGPLRSRCLK